VLTTVQNLKANIISLWENIKSWLSSTVSNIKTNVTTAFDNIKNNIVDRITGAKDAILNGMGEAADYISSLPGKFLEWGSDMIQSLIDGIKSKISGVVDAVSGVAETIASYLHFSVPDKGPLADADTYMPDFIKLMTSGIAKGLPQLESAAATMASALAPTSNLANGVTNNTSTNNVSINVYGAQGQDVSELADIIQDRINMNVYRNGAAFA
jgi:phage-related protein